MNVREKYINFFISKGHKQIPSAPIVPENDSSVLFNTAGMQPLVPYLMGEPHPYGKRLVDYQKCVRTNDLEEVGDKTHHTFFEMLGNWSLGDYFKKESITWSYEFLVNELKINPNRLAVTVYAGDEKVSYDKEAHDLWLNLGISEGHIAKTKEDNFWSAGATGPCGTDTEIFYFRSNDEVPEVFDTQDDRWVEIWNNVFMQYNRDKNGNITKLKNKNIDTGMGLERIVAVLEGKDDNYLSSIFIDLINLVEKISNKPYKGNEKYMRIIVDHIRTTVFILADDANIVPSNKDQGYVVRRLIRRMIRYAKKLDIDINSNFEEQIALLVINKYKKYYEELDRNKDRVLKLLREEKNKFNKTLEKGLKIFEKNSNKDIDADTAFHLYDTYGFPIELTMELAKEKNINVDVDGFKKKFKEHQELSRTSSKGKFKGGLAGDSEIEKRYHTATHLLNAALKIVLGDDTHQMGSNINTERMRFDFNSDHKLTKEELEETENIVNKWINEDLKVYKKEMTKEEALKTGAECRFIEKYPDIVTVYYIGDVSKELCGGPHVSHTKEIGHFKITKEESVSSGVRRIKAIIE